MGEGGMTVEVLVLPLDVLDGGAGVLMTAVQKMPRAESRFRPLKYMKVLTDV